MQLLKIHSAEEIKLKIQAYFHKNEEAKFIHRLHGVLLKIGDKKNSSEAISQLFGHSPRTISNWINKVNATGDIEVLRDVIKPGRTKRLNEDQLAAIKIILQQKPELNGVTANVWDGKSLSFYIAKTYDVSLGVRQCQRLFRQLGFTLKRARPIGSKGSPVKKEVAKKTSRDRKKQ